MTVQEYHLSGKQDHWLNQVRLSDWNAGQYLARLLEENRFHSLLGEKSRLLLLTEVEKLLSFCTYAQRDEIPAPELTPWVGFVYTFPECRGKRRAGKLLERAHHLAKADHLPFVYLSTGETGLYEKYGCRFWKTMPDLHGNESRVYRLPVEEMDYALVLGKRVSGTVDRPLGSRHPRHPEMVYPINYGYVDGIMAGDGAEQDVYIFGSDHPLRTFSGVVVGVYHRLNDCEDKWIVSVNGETPPREKILDAIAFQEQYFMGELYL